MYKNGKGLAPRRALKATGSVKKAKQTVVVISKKCRKYEFGFRA